MAENPVLAAVQKDLASGFVSGLVAKAKAAFAAGMAPAARPVAIFFGVAGLLTGCVGGKLL